MGFRDKLKQTAASLVGGPSQEESSRRSQHSDNSQSAKKRQTNEPLQEVKASGSQSTTHRTIPGPSHSESIGDWDHIAVKISTVHGLHDMVGKIHSSCAGYAWYMGSADDYEDHEKRMAKNADYDSSRETYQKVRRLAEKKYTNLLLDRGPLGSYATSIARAWSVDRAEILIAVTPKIAERELGVGSAALRASERFCAEYNYHPYAQQSRRFVWSDGTVHEPEEVREPLLPFFVKVTTRSATGAQFIAGPGTTTASSSYRLLEPFDDLSEGLNSLQVADNAEELNPVTLPLIWDDRTQAGGDSPTAIPETVSPSTQPYGCYSANYVPGAAGSCSEPFLGVSLMGSPSNKI